MFTYAYAYVYAYIYIYIYTYIYIYIYIHTHIPMYDTNNHTMNITYSCMISTRIIYGQFSKLYVCFCGLDAGNLKFETVRTHTQRICF